MEMFASLSKGKQKWLALEKFFHRGRINASTKSRSIFSMFMIKKKCLALLKSVWLYRKKLIYKLKVNIEWLPLLWKAIMFPCCMHNEMFSFILIDQFVRSDVYPLVPDIITTEF